MKKIFSCMLALFAAVSLYAADLNIFASALNATQTDSTVTIEYVLNAPADSLYFMIYGENINEALHMLETNPAALTKGAHEVVKPIPANTPSGVYHWAIKAFAPAHEGDSTIVSEVVVGGSRGMAFNDNEQSPFFGMFFIADNLGGGDGGKLLAVTPDFARVDTIATGWGSGSSSPMRVLISEDDMLFVTDWSDASPNVSMVNPATPGAPIVPVFGADHVDADGIAYTADNTPIHGSIAGGCLMGKGSNRVLYTMDEDVKVDGKMVIFSYNIGEVNGPWIAAPSGVAFHNTDNLIQNANVNFFPDGHGGFWLSQHRWADGAAIPSLAHIAANDSIDFHSAGEITAGGNNNRGSIFVTNDKEYVVTSSDGNAKIWRPFFTGDVLDSLVLVKTVAFPNIDNIFNVILDPAGNVYVIKGTGGALTAVAPATADNSCITRAASNNKIYIGVPIPVQHMFLIGDNTGWNPTEGLEMTCTADNVFEGSFTFTADTSYFAFFDDLAETNDQGGWDYVNAHRYAGKTDNLLLNHTAWSDSLRMLNHCFRIAPAGQYKLRVDLNKGIVTTFYQAPAAISDNAIYISFKDIEGKEGSDSGTAVTSIADIIKAGADYIDTIPTASKIYNARQGCGIKFGTSSVKGELTLRLKEQIIPEKIIINAISYGASEGTGVLMGDTIELFSAGNKVLNPYVKVSNGEAITELTFSTTAKRMYLIDVIIIPAEAPLPVVYKIKHPWDLNNVDPWMWKECEEQIDGTWALEAPYYGGGCNIDPKVLEQDWIASPVLVGNPYNGDSCRFVINPAATDVAGILTITKLGDPNPDTTVVVYDHLYEIGANQGWKPNEGVEMTKKSENIFEGTFTFSGASDSGFDYFGFITELNESWDVVNQHRFGPANDGDLVAIGENAMFENKGAGKSFKIAAGSYTFTVDINNMKLTIAPASGIENINGENNVQKVLRNGQIYIIRDGETYTVTGAKVE